MMEILRIVCKLGLVGRLSWTVWLIRWGL